MLCRRSADKLDRMLLAIKPVVGKRHSAAVFFSADIRLTEIRRLIRISAAAGGTGPTVNDNSASSGCSSPYQAVGSMYGIDDLFIDEDLCKIFLFSYFFSCFF